MIRNTGRTLSFEFFPPQSAEAALRLWRSVERLAPLRPDFVSVTYGAGGGTRERTNESIRAIRENKGIAVAGHLTCVGASRADTLAVAANYAQMGVHKIVALRGDPPKGQGSFVPHPDGFTSAAELVAALRGAGPFEIAVAAYPEVHPEARDRQSDLDNLKRKIDAGASSAITQFFFDPDDFLRFRDACAAAGITVPIHPGILPVENFEKLCRFAKGCAATIPEWMHAAFDKATTEAAVNALAIEIATETCDKLIENGVMHLHFYTLNNPDLPYAIARAIGFDTDGYTGRVR